MMTPTSSHRGPRQVHLRAGAVLDQVDAALNDPSCLKSEAEIQRLRERLARAQREMATALGHLKRDALCAALGARHCQRPRHRAHARRRRSPRRTRAPSGADEESEPPPHPPCSAFGGAP